MKKVFLMAAFCAAIVACNNNGKTASNSNGTDSAMTDSILNDSVRYEGMVPAADCKGIKYNIAIAAADSTVGYSLTQTYVGTKEGDKTFATTGKVEVITEMVDGKEVKAMKLVGKTKEDDLYLLQVSDSTVRIVGADLKGAVEGAEKYDLKLK